jgi:hypothetical protein
VVNGPPEVVANANPVKGPTVIFAVVRLAPLIVKDPEAVVLIHTSPKSASAVAVSVGEAGALIVKDKVLEGAAAPVVVTPTLAVPATAISDADTDASSCVLLTKVVGRSAPFQVTVDNPLTKFVTVYSQRKSGITCGCRRRIQ